MPTGAEQMVRFRSQFEALLSRRTTLITKRPLFTETYTDRIPKQNWIENQVLTEKFVNCEVKRGVRANEDARCVTKRSIRCIHFQYTETQRWREQFLSDNWLYTSEKK
jgi:hypothetical protein